MLELRPFQREALQALSGPAHLICVAPTGSGKSLIYERLAARPGTRTLLVTPLVALARQQRERLGAAGIPVSPQDGSGAWIVSPENLEHPAFQARLRRWKPDLLVMDECHCLWDWGDTFRPAFRKIPALIGEHAIPRSLWLTATLPPDARRMLRESLPAAPLELGCFELPARLRLELVRVPWLERSETLLGWIQQQRGTGIVFVPTREAAMRLSRLLAAAGISTLAYHAGMGTEERRALEQLISEHVPRAIVATSAFGMGMDYAHLQWVALWQAPLSILALAQAAGRVGRAGREGRALVLWDDDDFRMLEWSAGHSRRRLALTELRALLSAQRCRRASLALYFDGVERAGGCGACDFCVG